VGQGKTVQLNHHNIHALLALRGIELLVDRVAEGAGLVGVRLFGHAFEELDCLS
jgi:hypothetical protein